MGVNIEDAPMELSFILRFRSRSSKLLGNELLSSMEYITLLDALPSLPRHL